MIIFKENRNEQQRKETQRVVEFQIKKTPETIVA